MQNKKQLVYWSLAAVIIIAIAGVVFYQHSKNNPGNLGQTNVSLVEPRGNTPRSAPKDGGFKNFTIPVPGVLSRSGQPSLADFQWLKANGWKSDIDVRIDGEKRTSPWIPKFRALTRSASTIWKFPFPT
ncbi:MAG: hypothetical protein P4L58_00735 [Candidatus Pacebacteria bacterium]|nr:hypothetical protein [Candidatus Paceibacterota bacterium]